MSAPPVARVTTLVPLEAAEAFSLFTEPADTWWRCGPRFRPELGDSGVMCFEPGEGGQLLERYAAGEPFELERVRAWEPGVRLAFSMRGP